MLAGALPPAERAAIADHAAACARCHALIDGLIETPAPGAAAQALADMLPRGADGGDAAGMLELGRGARVGRYVIEERLGAGGMGVVHAALDSELHRRVALKLLRPDGQGHGGGDGRERLLREARTLARLSHPNVVTVFDVGAHGGHLFVAMELVYGGSLSAWLRRAPRAHDAIIDRLVEAGRGLAAAHAAGVVHRDIKPDNILVGLDGRARVTDFGLARLGDPPAAPGDPASAAREVRRDPPLALTRTGAQVGTPAYMAPEQWACGETDARADQWSFCATLYEALAGVRPFDAADPEARASAIAEGRLAAPAAGRRVPGWVWRIVTRGLRADPAARWPSMDTVVRALVRGRQRRRRAAIAGGVTIAGLAAKLLRRHKAGIAAAVGILVLLWGAIIVAPYMHTTSRRQTEDRPITDLTVRSAFRPGVGGTWITIYGGPASGHAMLGLQQTGDTVSGSYAGNHKGTVSGRLAGFVLVGRWTEGERPSVRGNLIFTFNVDFSAFSGRFTSDDGYYSGEWNGVRAKDPDRG